MSDYVSAILALVLATLASVSGTVLLRLAETHDSLPLAIVGSSLWSLSGAGFVFASNRGLELGLAATAMSTIGLVAINLIGLAYFQDTFSIRKILGLSLIVFAMILMAWPSAKA